MPLGEVIAEIVMTGVFEVLGKPLIALVRLPGALVGWAIWRKRSWKQVWSKGDAFGQGFVGFFVHLTWLSLLGASCN